MRDTNEAEDRTRHRIMSKMWIYGRQRSSINFYRRQKRQLHHQKIVLEARLKLWTQTRVLPLSQLRQLNVLNAEIVLHSGGCCRRDPLMKRLHNSIGVLDVAIHGEIIPNSRSFHPSNK